jgi:hypothetical protein
VNVQRTGALLMLVVVALWAALPAFACFAPAQEHACCQHMTRDCGPTMGADSTCCQLRQSDGATPATTASVSERSVVNAPNAQAISIPALLLSGSRRVEDAGGSPPRPSPKSSILRI